MQFLSRRSSAHRCIFLVPLHLIPTKSTFGCLKSFHKQTIIAVGMDGLASSLLDFQMSTFLPKMYFFISRWQSVNPRCEKMDFHTYHCAVGNMVSVIRVSISLV